MKIQLEAEKETRNKDIKAAENKISALTTELMDAKVKAAELSGENSQLKLRLSDTQKTADNSLKKLYEWSA